jgi:uncharacterized protein YraI
VPVHKFNYKRSSFMNIFNKFGLRGMFLAVLMLFSISLTAAQGNSQIHFVHVIPGATAIDVYVNGTLALTGLEFGKASTYLTVPAGNHTITVTPAGIPTLLWEQTVNAEADEAFTLIASSPAALKFDVLRESLTGTGFGTGRLQIVHALAGGPAFDVQLGESVIVGNQTADAGTVIQPGLSYGNVVEYDLPSQTYKFNFLAGTSNLLSDVTIPLSTNTSLLAVVYGTTDAPQILMVTTPTQPSADTGLVQLVHGVVDAPAVDVYINDVLAVPALNPDHPTGHIALPSGEAQVSLRASGTEDEIFAGSVAITAGEAQTVVILQGDTGIDLVSFTDNVGGVTASNAVASVINTIPGSDSVNVTLADGTALGSTVAFGEASGAANIPPTTSPLTFQVTIGDRSGEIQVPAQTFYGGVYYNVIALGGGAFAAPRLLFAPTSLSQGLASAPGAGTITFTPVQQPTQDTAAIVPTQPSAQTEISAQPTVGATLPSEVLPPGTAVPNIITARVLLDPGANLQLREYPRSDARSLGLAPSGTTLVVNGREGAEVALVAGEEPPPEATDFVDAATLLDPADPKADLIPEETWLNVAYSTPDGGTITAWVNSLYVDVRNGKNERMKLRDLPFVGRNIPGGAQATALTPPPIPEDRLNVVIIGLNAGANVNIRRTPQTDGEVLGRVPNGTVLDLIGLNETDEWAFISFSPSSGGTITGWVSTLFVEYQLNDKRITLEDLKLATGVYTKLPVFVVVPDDQRGAITGGASGVNLPTPDPLKDAFIAEVKLDQGANLQLRRTPDAAAESLNLVPAGTRLVITSRNSTGEWVNVSFEGETGWINSQYVVITYNGALVDVQEVPVEGAGTSATDVPAEATEQTSAG